MDLSGGTALASVLRVLLALAGVCGLAWVVLAVFARRGLVASAGGLGRTPSRLRVLERVSLSPRRQLYLVQADSRVFLVGTGEAGPPALIAELDSASKPEDRSLRAAPTMEAAS
jgi:flagellar biogenesis protein FliO